MSLNAGTRLGPYELESLIGTGGMGEVYLAHDTRLGRRVALKRLSEGHTERFAREARAIAALNHPNICQVYDVGPDFLVLEYLEGRSPQGPMEPRDLCRLGGELASALAAAHERGILHRDLKPANVIVTITGTTKLLDFGVAKMLTGTGDVDVTGTGTGSIVGTVAYMSPEQAQGLSLDARSDVFSLGAVLYELAAGRRAFDGQTTVQVITALLRDEPPPFAAPAVLERVIRRCLAKAPDDRFQTMTELGEALAAAATERALYQPSIAVLPFANLSADPDNEFFCDGLAEEIISTLAKVTGVKVIARTSAFAFKGRNEDIRRIAQALGVTKVLEGAVRRAGRQVRVTAQLISAADGTQVWSDRYDRTLDDVFAMQDDIAQAIADALALTFARKGAINVPEHRPSAAAYEALLRGRHLLYKFTPETWDGARALFEEAIRLDPGYAAPHAALGMGYFMIGMHGMAPLSDIVPKVRDAAERALALAPGNPEPRFLLGGIAAAYDYDWPRAAEHFRAAMATPHPSADARWAYASFYFEALGRYEESIAEMRRSVDQDPLNPIRRAVLSAHLTHGRLFDAAIDEAEKAIALDEHYYVPHGLLGETYLVMGRFEDAVPALERAHELAPWSPLATGILAAGLRKVGQEARAAALIESLGPSPRPAWGRVMYHLLGGEIEEATEWFADMVTRREPFAILYALGPIMRPVRSHPRWTQLATEMRLPLSRR